MTACMKHNIPGSQTSATLQRPGEQGNGFLPVVLIERAQVNEIGRVNDHRVQTTVLSRLGKQCIPCRVICRWSPASGIAGKNLNGITPYLPGDFRRFDKSGIGGNMASNTHYLCSSLSCSFCGSPSAGAVRASANSTCGNCSRLVRPNCCRN